MAGKGNRDLKVSFLTDLDRFNTDPAARGLEDVADAAGTAARALDDVDGSNAARGLDDVKGAASDTARALDNVDGSKAGRELDTAGTAAKGAGDDLDKLAKDAKATAGKVDDAFDRIAASSKSSMSKVGTDTKHGMDDAGEATATFKDEAKANLSEVASSFQGDMTSAVDLVQGTLGGVVQDLGPLGLALGAAGAAGLGLIASSIQEAKERVSALTQSFLDLRKQGIDPAADSAAHLVDELDAGDLAKYKRDADQLGLSYDVLREAFDGNADAIDTARKAIEAYNDANATGNPYTGQQADLMSDLTLKLNETEKAYNNATDASKFLAGQQADATAATEAHTAALDAHGAALDAFVDPVNVYTSLLADKNAAEQATAQATADATKNEKDSWEDYAKSVSVSVDEYLAELERQVKAQESWATNLAALAERGVSDGVLAELERMGPEGAPLVAKLTKASDAELTRLVTLMGRQGEAAGRATAANIAEQGPAVSRAARKLHDAAAVAMARTITVPVRLEDATPAARLAWGQADAYFRRNPITIRTKGPTGQRPVRDVP